MGFWRLYTPEQVNRPVITGELDIMLCVAAVFLAILAALVLLPVTDRYHAFKNKFRLLWLGAGSMAMGTGIWAMFFTNVLALKLPFPVHFDPLLTLLSIIPPVVASGSCITLFVSAGVSTLRLHQASLLLAIGVGSMHYIGMEALVVPADMYYIPSLFLVSILTAYGFAMVGLNVKIMLSGNRYLGTLIGSTVLGLAVSSTQFVALRATYFVANEPLLEGQLPGTLFVLLGTIAGVTLLLLLLIVVGSKVDKQLRDMADSLKQSEVRFQRLAETTPTAIFTFNRSGLTYANDALSEITRHSPETIASVSLPDLLGTDFSEFANKALDDTSTQKHTYQEQVQCKTRDGETRWLQVSATRIDSDDEPLCLASACDISKQKMAEQSLHKLAYTDPLTQLNNRASFMKQLGDFLDGGIAGVEGESCVLLIDLDNFNRYNDTLGYTKGDEILRETAGRMKSFYTDSCIPARLNGDEFAMLVKGCKAYDSIELLAENLYAYSLALSSCQTRTSISI